MNINKILSYALGIGCALTLAVQGQVGNGATNVTTTTTSTKTITINQDTPVSSVARQYSIRVQGVLIDSSANRTVVFDQVFTDGPAHTAIDGALVQARQSVINAAGSRPLGLGGGEQFGAGNTTVANSTSFAVTNQTQTLTTNSTLYVGPQTIQVGPEQSQTLIIAPGSRNIDTLVTTTVIVSRDVTTTTNTTKTATYQVVGTLR